MRWLIFLLPLLASAQARPGSVHGKTVRGAEVRLLSPDHADVRTAQIDQQGAFQLNAVPAGWYLLTSAMGQSREAVKAIEVTSGRSVDAGDVRPAPVRAGEAPGTLVLTVCEALAHPEPSRGAVIIVGIFKSGMDETLRQDCPTQLLSGDVGWLSGIALSNPATPPDSFREQIEKKKGQLFAAYPPEAKPRAERIVGLYGILEFPDGLTAEPCCHAQIETTFAPARLIGVGEKDRRVIR